MVGSDTLLIFLLKASRPAVYRDVHRYIDGRIVHERTVGVRPILEMTDAERQARIAEIKARARARAPQLTYIPPVQEGQNDAP